MSKELPQDHPQNHFMRMLTFKYFQALITGEGMFGLIFEGIDAEYSIEDGRRFKISVTPITNEGTNASQDSKENQMAKATKKAVKKASKKVANKKATKKVSKKK
jgi:hypothetical protein